jgi:hypothetical protein
MTWPDAYVGSRIQGVGLLQRGLVVLALNSVVGKLRLQPQSLGNGWREFGRPVIFQAAVLVLFPAAARAGIVATGFWHGGPSYQYRG